MLEKKRKLNKEELNLWKEVTKKDIKLKSYQKETAKEKRIEVKNINNIEKKNSFKQFNTS